MAKRKILIIDDTPANIQVINQILQDHYRIYFAVSGSDGLNVAQRELPDLILLDIMMPEMDGYEVCAALKSNEATSRIPVIFITAITSIEDEARGLEAGAIDYITKPISPPVLKIRIKNHLELKHYSDKLMLLTKELTLKNQQLEVLARQDSLTGLANRRWFNEAMCDEVRRAQRSGETLSLLMVDLDCFKNYNDHYGHLAGDECLRLVGRTLLASFKRAGDLPVRYGGEEFVVILPNTKATQSLKLAENLRRKVAHLAIPHSCSEVASHVTCSVGVVTAQASESRSADWFTFHADKALYQAKDAGRNRVVSMVFDDFHDQLKYPQEFMTGDLKS
ncbi:diguanylate cyclase [Pelotalea chapellei]|uniref:diguanylate cyclase n=1 Tax=Pelotalea chapellei TaxID=44671 RepID=UPI0034625C9D